MTKTWHWKLAAVFVLVFVLAITALNVITFTFTYNGEHTATLAAQNAARDGLLIKQLLLDGKTASAVSAKKTASIAQEIENLVIAYHADTQASATQAAQAASAAKATTEKGTKELPTLLKQVETAISAEDAKSINTAVQEAVTSVEQYFATHPVTSVAH